MPEQLPSPTSGEVHSDVPFTSWVPPRNHRRPVPLSINTDSTGYPTPPGSFHSREPSFNVPDITIEVVQSPEADMQSFVSPAHFTTSPVVTFKWCNGTCRDDPFAIKCDKVFEETKVVSRFCFCRLFGADFSLGMSICIKRRRAILGGRQWQVVDPISRQESQFVFFLYQMLRLHILNEGLYS